MTYLVFDYNGDLIAEDIESDTEAKELAEAVYGSYERQY